MDKKRKKRSRHSSSQVNKNSAETNPQNSVEEEPRGLPYARVWIVAAIFFGVYVVIASNVLMRFPNSGDEYSYLLQAKIFAQGDLSVPSVPEPIRDSFVLDHVIDDGHVCSKYTPGWPLLLSVGELLGQPWLINPLLGALLAAIVFLILWNIGENRAAWLAMIAMGLSPFLAFQSASYMSHVSVLFTQALALWIVSSRRARNNVLWLFVAGMVVGFGFLIRPLDGALAGLAFLAWFGLSEIKRALWFGLGVLPMLIVFLWYNAAQFGDPFTTGYDVYRPMMLELYRDKRTEFGLENIVHFAAHVRWLTELSAWLIPGTLITVPLGVLHIWRKNNPLSRKIVVYCLTFLGLLIVVSQLVIPSKGDTYGPRYLMLALLPVAIFSGAGVYFVFKQFQLPRYLVLSICVICATITIGKYFEVSYLKSRTIEKRMALQRAVEGQDFERAVIFMGRTYGYRAHWYTRNEPDFRGDVVYVIDKGPIINAKVMTHYTDYTGYRFHWKEGTFEPL